MKQYKHTELNEDGFTFVEKVQYRERDVLLRHFYGDDDFHGNTQSRVSVSVLGFIVGDYMRPIEGTSVPVTNVEPITDTNHRKELTDLIRQKGVSEPVYFW